MPGDEAKAGVGEEERGLKQRGQHGLHSLHVRDLPSHQFRKLKYFLLKWNIFMKLKYFQDKYIPTY